MTTPLVSILTPSYNQASWLSDNLKSVANQTYENVEHIVMDGGSTDGSIAILQQSGPHVRWRSEPDRGQSHALNKAFDESHGEFIGWINSDDAYVDRRAIEAVAETFARRPEADVLYGHGLLVNAENRVLQYLWAPPFNNRLFKIGTFFIQPSVFIRRSILQPPFVDENLNVVMDHDLWWRLFGRATFQRLNVVVGLDRHQPGRKTLQAEYQDEWRSHQQALDIDPDSRRSAALRKLSNIAMRFRGAANTMTLPRGLDPAIDLKFGTLQSRILLQTLTPRRRMPLE